MCVCVLDFTSRGVSFFCYNSSFTNLIRKKIFFYYFLIKHNTIYIRSSLRQINIFLGGGLSLFVVASQYPLGLVFTHKEGGKKTTKKKVVVVVWAYELKNYTMTTKKKILLFKKIFFFSNYLIKASLFATNVKFA